MERIDEAIETITKELPDYELFLLLPGVGHIQAPRLLVAFGEDRGRFSNASQVQRYVDIAPIIEGSGNRCGLHWRVACPTFLRQTFVEWAGSTVTGRHGQRSSIASNATKGAGHGVANRTLAIKWIRILYRVWKTQRPYSEAAYLDALKRRGSPLIAVAASASKIP